MVWLTSVKVVGTAVGVLAADAVEVVGAEGDRDARVDDGPQRDPGRVGIHPESDVAAGADLQGHARLGDAVQGRRVLTGPDAVTDAVRLEHGERVDDRRGPEQATQLREQRVRAVHAEVTAQAKTLGGASLRVQTHDHRSLARQSLDGSRAPEDVRKAGLADVDAWLAG